MSSNAHVVVAELFPRGYGFLVLTSSLGYKRKPHSCCPRTSPSRRFKRPVIVARPGVDLHDTRQRTRRKRVDFDRPLGFDTRLLRTPHLSEKHSVLRVGDARVQFKGALKLSRRRPVPVLRPKADRQLHVRFTKTGIQVQSFGYRLSAFLENRRRRRVLQEPAVELCQGQRRPARTPGPLQSPAQGDRSASRFRRSSGAYMAFR